MLIRDFHSCEKLAHPFYFLLLYCLIAGPAAPQGCPLRRTLTPSCHSKANSFICVELPHNPVTLSVCLLSPPRWAWSHTQHTTFLGSFFTFISSVCSLNSTCPLFALFPFFALSLFLQTPHYPLSAFLILSLISHCLSRPNLPLFTASVHLLPPPPLFYFIDLSETSYSVPIRCATIKREDAGD